MINANRAEWSEFLGGGCFNKEHFFPTSPLRIEPLFDGAIEERRSSCAAVVAHESTDRFPPTDRVFEAQPDTTWDKGRKGKDDKWIQTKQM